MKRRDIEDLFIDIRDYEDVEEAQKDVEKLQEKVTDFIDYIEQKFGEIRDVLGSIDINTLDKIVDCRNLACQISEDLY